ncbi:MAG: Sec-independent protein translocase protein TatB [Gammaproteobacteria bacterium]|nr:Sec-independent protein translocase protein TatB [Gammaproteobacteria bacterium]
MFDIGFWEIMLISILAMVVIGPERLPGVARTAGRWFGKARRFIEGVKYDVENEFDTAELKRLLHNQEVQLKELQGKVNTEAGDIRSGFSYSLDDDNTAKAKDDDYLEFMDENEEKDHEQIAAEKAPQEDEFYVEARETKSFAKPAVENQNKTDDDHLDNSKTTDKNA